ncbi:YajQ family cyclic di-GMP-binding protein [Algicola sagamiensis]|uniref:YajQ family cyclic di-GMP-binding protein n=1 Tax=Algicola sagamiensis TaxID=163869 RepID=UPI00037836E2|nr:YajQ family cyclic di-GMP-binding protein [Algicola sagamiensis]
MPSFDIVSELDAHEIKNAVENANRELSTRYDFRGVDATFELTDDLIKLKAEAEIQLQQMIDILSNKAIKRDLDPRSFDIKDMVHSGKTYLQDVGMKQGIDTPTAKKIVKMIKDSKIKVQASIQGDQVRITGKKRDDLQSVMQLVRECDIDQPFQFTNFRD